MAINIKVYSKDNINDFTSCFSDEQVLETGSVNAIVAALAASLLKKSSTFAPESDKKDFIVKNSEILRSYFVHLIDDDVKCRAGYNKELKLGNEDNIEAAVHPACSINEELISMCTQMLELGLELKPLIDIKYHHYLSEMSEFAISVIKSSITWLINFTSQCKDETYKFVVKRENELNLDYAMELYGKY